MGSYWFMPRHSGLAVLGPLLLAAHVGCAEGSAVAVAMAPSAKTRSRRRVRGILIGTKRGGEGDIAVARKKVPSKII